MYTYLVRFFSYSLVSFILSIQVIKMSHGKTSIRLQIFHMTQTSLKLSIPDGNFQNTNIIYVKKPAFWRHDLAINVKSSTLLLMIKALKPKPTDNPYVPKITFCKADKHILLTIFINNQFQVCQSNPRNDDNLFPTFCFLLPSLPLTFHPRFRLLSSHCY